MINKQRTIVHVMHRYLLPSLQAMLPLFVLLLSLLISFNANAVSVELNGTKSLLSGSECDIARYRVGTKASYNGQALDLIVDVLEEDNDYVGPCLQLTGNQLSFYLRDEDASDNVAYMDLKFTVVKKGTLTPVEVDRILVTNFDLDSVGNSSVTATDDVYYKNADGAYISNNSLIEYSEGSFFGGKYNAKMRGRTTGNCNDGTSTVDVTCRGAGIWINGDNGINTVSSIYARAQNDNAYGTHPHPQALRLIQFSFELKHFENLVTVASDYGDAPNNYGSAGHKLSASLGLGFGEIADNESAHQASTLADADDNDSGSGNFDDDNAVSLGGQALNGQTLTEETTINLSVATFGAGYLNGWVDWNRDGDFSDANEHFLDDQHITTPSIANNSIAVSIPAAVSEGDSFMRFRYSTTANMAASGYSSSAGEVEDYPIVLQAKVYDYGDAPNDGTDFNYGVAKHVINASDGLIIGVKKAKKDQETELSSWTKEWTKSKDKADWFTDNKKERKKPKKSKKDKAEVTLETVPVVTGDGDEEDGLTVNAFEWANGKTCTGLLADGTTGTVTMTEGSYCVTVKASNTATIAAQLVGWVDFDQSGTFDDPEERSVVNVDADTSNDATQGNVPTGTSAQDVVVYWEGIDKLSGAFNSFIRLRLTSDPAFKSDHSPDPIGVAITGEVEDTAIGINIEGTDYGDAPASYGDASHIIELDAYLGTTIDNEATSQNTANGGTDGTGDDVVDIVNHNYNDDDGVSTLASLDTLATTYSVDVIATTPTTEAGHLVGWIDFDGNGVFDSDEAATVVVPQNTTESVVTLQWSTIPADIQAGNSYLRLRLTTDVSIATGTASTSVATGLASDGEVEDYAVTIGALGSSCSPVPVTTLGNASVNANNEYILTQDVNNQSGFIWSNEKIDLSQAFDIQLGVYLGSNVGINPSNGLDSGADGLSFILQNDPRGIAAQGQIGGFMGVDGDLNLAQYGLIGTPAIAPSLTIEFDTFDNTPFQSTGDIAVDHTAIYLNGDVYIPDAANTLLAATSVGTAGEIEDGQYHLTRYVWNPASQLLTYYFDGVQLTSINHDLIAYFGSNYVTFGFAAATGSSKNLHKACWITAPTVVTPAVFDFGDAPIIGTAPDGSGTNSYGVASHTIVSGTYLGAGDPDVDSANQPTAHANGDDTDGTDDEDGITLPTLTQGQTAMVTATVAGSGGYLQGWIDWDGNGMFDVGEQIATDLQDGGALDANGAAGIVAFDVAVPMLAITSQTYARFRWSTTAALDSTTTAPDGEVEDYPLTIEVGGFSVKGRVYKDTNVDGVNNDANGVSGLPVVLLDVNANTCVSTKTDAQGNYVFASVLAGDYQLYEASREKVPTPQNCDVTKTKDPSSYRSTTPNVLAQFSVVDAEITGKDFGDVQEPLFVPNNTGSILPNSVVFYKHQFTASSTGSVDFTDSNTGNITIDWSSVIYQDTNCNNTLDGAEGNAPIAANLPTVAGQTICLINKVYAPANVSGGENYSNMINADFNFNNNAITGTITLTVTDLTKVAANDPEAGASRLELRKTVENITQNTAETETQNQAKPEDILKYRIYYSNTGTGALTDLIINDEVPAFTTLVNGSLLCGSLPASLTSCTPSDNGSVIKWEFPATDALKGGASGVVSYEVKID